MSNSDQPAIDRLKAAGFPTFTINKADAREEVREMIRVKSLTHNSCLYRHQHGCSNCVVGQLLLKRGATEEQLRELDKESMSVTSLITGGFIVTDNVGWLEGLQDDYDCADRGHFEKAYA